ncbi:hypothetical protein LXL04_027437 [Taraxacum kok-saghyz]
MSSEPPPRRALHPRKPPDPNIPSANPIPKSSIPQRKRRSTSPNSRGHRSAVTAKFPINSGSQGTNSVTPPLLEKLDSRVLLKATESSQLNHEDTTIKNQIMMETYTNSTKTMYYRIPDNPQPSLINQSPATNDIDVNVATTETWFELDHEKSLNTEPIAHTNKTTSPTPTPITVSQPTIPKFTIPQNIQQQETTTKTNTNPTNANRSYANVTSFVSRRSKAKLQYFPPTNNETAQSPVVIPIQLCEQANEKHANTLFGYFIGANPSFSTVRDQVKNKWASCGITDIQRNGKGFYLFKFSTEQGMMNVLQSEHWMIKDPGTCLTKAKHDKVPVWVKIHDIPLEAWSVEGIGRIASRIGIPYDMDTYT